MGVIGNLIVNLRARTAQFDKKMKGSRARLKRFEKRVRSVEAAAGKLTRSMKRVGLVIGAAAAGGMALAIKEATSFERQMAQVSTMLGKQTSHYLPEYNKQVRKLAVGFGQTTETLSKGLYDILSASIAPAKAMGVLTVASKAAVGGFTDVATSVDAITSILNAYSLEADQAAEVSDILFGVVKRGKTTFPELAGAIGKVASTAATAGISLEDVGASIATMTRAGIDTDNAVTALNATLLAFLKPSNEGARAARQFGLALNLQSLQTHGLVGALSKLKTATATQLATIFPNIRGLKGVAAALQNLSGLQADYTGLLNSSGMSQEAFGKASGTAAFKFEQLRQAFKGVLITFGEEMLPMVKEGVDKVTKWLGANKGELKAWAKTVGDVMRKAMAEIGDFMIGIVGLVQGQEAADKLRAKLYPKTRMTKRHEREGLLKTGDFGPRTIANQEKEVAKARRRLAEIDAQIDASQKRIAASKGPAGFRPWRAGGPKKEKMRNTVAGLAAAQESRAAAVQRLRDRQRRLDAMRARQEALEMGPGAPGFEAAARLRDRERARVEKLTGPPPAPPTPGGPLLPGGGTPPAASAAPAWFGITEKQADALLASADRQEELARQQLAALAGAGA